MKFEVETEWTENGNGNFVLRESGGNDALATVFHNYNKGYWQIIVNGEGEGQLVANEHYDTAEEAMDRAAAIRAGAKCQFAPDPLLARATHTRWQQQKAKHNGSLTYGRKAGDWSASVKMATSKKWFFVAYSGATSKPPTGWFDSAEQAMGAFDATYGSV